MLEVCQPEEEVGLVFNADPPSLFVKKRVTSRSSQRRPLYSFDHAVNVFRVGPLHFPLFDAASRLNRLIIEAEARFDYRASDQWQTGAILRPVSIDRSENDMVAIEFIGTEFCGALPTSFIVQISCDWSNSSVADVVQHLAATLDPPPGSGHKKQTRREPADALRNSLKVAIDRKMLTDLHTHFTGMGNANFWVNQIMKTTIPAIVHQVTDTQTTVENRIFGRLRLVGQDDLLKHFDQIDRICSAALNAAVVGNGIGIVGKDDYYREFFMANFTEDVVYPKDELLKAFFGYDPSSQLSECHNAMHPDDALWRLEQLICNPRSTTFFADALRPYVIFNCKSRMFEYVVGLTNTTLMSWMEGDSDEATSGRAALDNCFEMLDNRGGRAGNADLKSYRGKFSPQFNPMRYALKDPLIQQQPIVLSCLLNHVAYNYYRNGVSYVELSVSLREAMRPHFRRYVQPAMVWPPDSATAKRIAPGFLFKFSPEGHFTYRFLAGMPRTDAVYDRLNGIALPGGHVLDFDTPRPLDVGFRRRMVSMLWPLYEQRRQLLQQRMFGSRTVDKSPVKVIDEFTELYLDPERGGFLREYVVGFDCMSEEDGFPCSPFAHDEVIACLKSIHALNPKFGVRLHAGEGVKRGSSVQDEEKRYYLASFGAHMNIIFHDIETIRGEIAKLPLRIGHGVAFMTQPDVLECPAYIEDRIQYPEWHSQMFTVPFGNMREFFRRNHIVFELNMQSNRYLMPDTFQRTQLACDVRLVLRQMLEQNMLVTLTTDNDGIWPCSGCGCGKVSDHQSVAFEFCAAIADGCFHNLFELHDVIRNGSEYAFRVAQLDTCTYNCCALS